MKINNQRILWMSFITIMAVSCYGKKMMKTPGDAPKLKANEQQFIGKPLKMLLNEIKPNIITAFGDPETAGMGDLGGRRTGHFSFYFVDKQEYHARRKKGETPVHILVTVAPAVNKKKYPELPKTTKWDNSIAKMYEDMTVLRIAVFGKD